MYQRRQWVNHKAKRPIDAKTGGPASSTDPSTCSTYAETVAMVTDGKADGIGFVLTAYDPYVCVDIDHCIDEDGNIDPAALAIVEALDSYVEISPSGTGLHVWLIATIPGERNRTGNIEIYETGRYMTVTDRPLPGYPAPVRESQAQLDALYAELFPAKPTPAPAAAPTLTIDAREIVDRLQHDDKGRALMAGDTSGHSGDHSKARMALAWKARYWHADESQIASILRASSLWKDEHDDKERDRRAGMDATKAVETYHGAFYSPDYQRPTIARLIAPEAVTAPPVVNDADIGAMGIEELRAQLQASRQRVAAQAKSITAFTQLTDTITTILECDEIESGPRLAAIGSLLVCVEKRADGEEPGKDGYLIPASWIARKVGLKPKTISKGLTALQGSGLIERKVINAPVEIRDTFTDSSTGETWTETRMKPGKQNYIAFPDNIVDFAHPFANHTRTAEAEESKHGGPRVACPEHPDAGTYTEHITRCRQCRKELDRNTTQHGPAAGTFSKIPTGWESPTDRPAKESKPKMGIDSTDGTVTIDRPIMGIDTPAATPAMPNTMMGVDPPAVDTSPGWEETRRAALVDSLRAIYLAQPGVNESDFESALPGLLKRKAEDAALAGESEFQRQMAAARAGGKYSL